MFSDLVRFEHGPEAVLKRNRNHERSFLAEAIQRQKNSKISAAQISDSLTTCCGCVTCYNGVVLDGFPVDLPPPPT